MLNSYEEIASQLHPTKNNGLTPDKVKANSIEKYWFLCPNTCEEGCLHEWLTSPQSRTLKKTGCPYCAKGSTVICIHQSLAYKHKELMDEWNYDKNIDINPDKTRPGSDKKVSWICKVCAMEWEAAIKARTKGSGCPGCNGKVGVKPVTKMNSLEGKFPEIAKEWHPTKNGDKLPSQYKYGSLEKVWWLCPNTCGYEGCIQHDYETTITSRTRKEGSGCPYCSTTTPKICYHQSLEYRFPDIAKLWHPTKNEYLTPDKITPFNSKKVWWLCPNTNCDYNCIHEYEQDICSKTLQKSGCPYCKENGNKKICIHNSFGINFKLLSSELHPTMNNCIDLNTITKHSNIKLFWKCKNSCRFGCEHIFEQSINARANGSGCPYCLAYGDAKKFCYHETLEFKFPDIAKEWDYNKNNLTPSEVTCGSGIRVWWKCDKNHEWNTRIMDRTTKGNCCRICNIGNNYSKISMQWLKYLELTYKIQHAENGGEFCIPNTNYKADGYCIKNNTIFEFNGSMFHGEPRMFKRDDVNPLTKITYGELYDKTIKKRNKLIELGYNYVEVWEKDWKDGIKALRKIQRKWKKRTRI